MTPRSRSLLLTATALAAIPTAAQAADLYWQGGTGPLNSANYYNATTPTPDATPVAGDILFIGEDGVTTVATGETLSFGRLRVGHGSTAGQAAGALPGAGNLNLTGGTLALAGANTGGGVDGGLFVGFNADGTMNLSGDAAVTVGRFIKVGYDNLADTLTGSGTGRLNLSGNASLTLTNNNLTVGTELPGHIAVADNASLSLLNTGNGTLGIAWTSNSTLTQTGGTISTPVDTYVGRNNTTSSSINLSGGTLNTRALTVGDETASNASLSVSGTATLNATGNVFIGRGNSTNASFSMTGGTVNANYFLVGNGFNITNDGIKATGAVANHSAGTINTILNVTVGDYEADAVYNLSGTGAINSQYSVLVGRRVGTSSLNQTGGSVTAARGVRIGDQQPDANNPLDIVRSADGTYNVSAGTLTANTDNVATRDALAIAPAGTGTLRVIGDDATITVNGNAVVYNTAVGTGTLAYQLESGDPGLSRVNVTGTATFAAGSILSLDFAGLTPAASSFDLLTAADIVDNGLVFSAPTGWSFEIVPGGNGELLRALSSTPVGVAGDVNGDGVVNLGDINYVTARWLNAGPAGDANNDGVVNLGDINYITARWLNTSEPGGVSVAALAAVPEPASLSLLALGSLATLARRRRNA